MAPKRVKASQIVPKEVGVLKLPLSEFDVGEESGWRSLNDDRAAELLKEFLDGHFGMNVLKDPMVRAVAGEPKRSADYKVLLADGKHKVVALQRALAIYEDAEKCEDYEWSDKLVEVFTDGLNVARMGFQEDDTDILLAYQTAAHDEAANQAFWSDLKDFATVAKRWRARTAGVNGQTSRRSWSNCTTGSACWPIAWSRWRLRSRTRSWRRCRGSGCPPRTSSRTSTSSARAHAKFLTASRRS